MSNNKERRIRLFNKYNENWRLIRPKFNPPIPEKFDEGVMCPLCGVFYTAAFLDLSNENHFTLEDVPPRQLGGRPLILTCKKCNNFAGHSVDDALADFIEKKPFMDGTLGAEIYLPRSTILYEGGKITSSATLKIAAENTLAFKINISKGEYRYTEFLKLHTRRGMQGNFHFHTPSLKFVQIALLKIAYLLLFHKFGHGFSFNRNYQPIRKQILSPEKNILPSFGVMHPNAIDASPGIYLYCGQQKMKSFIVVFDLAYKKIKTKNVVFVPSPFINATKFYADLALMDNFKFNFGEKFIDENFLTDPIWSSKWIEAFLR